MWVGLVPLVLVKLWLVYVMLVTRGRYWASAFGGPDPLVPVLPYGAAAALLVVVLALEPWRGPQLAYRCGRWPAVSVATTLSVGAGLFAVGRWLVPGAA